MPQEIERKFLVASDDWKRDAGPGQSLRQAIVFSEGDRILRIRLVEGKPARLTVKIGIDATRRHEYEYPVPDEHAEELLRMANGTMISKTRYNIPHAGYVWEVDCYHGPLDGLVTAEVEMAGVDEDPAIPAWIGREVTGDRRFSNQALAEGSLGADWRHHALSP